MSAENLRCSVCNNQILPDFKFCPSCGATNPYYRPKEAVPPTWSEAPSAEQVLPLTQPPETVAYSYPTYEASPPVDDQAAGVSGSPGPLDFAASFSMSSAKYCDSVIADTSKTISCAKLRMCVGLAFAPRAFSASNRLTKPWIM